MIRLDRRGLDMDAKDSANLAALLSRHADIATRSRQSALATLVGEGIVDTNGKLTPAYGGGADRDIKAKKKQLKNR